MHKTIRRGFTLVEMMVVMTIIAILSVIGLAALMNINSANTVDRATEEIIAAIRESQNKAISIVSDPAGGTVSPLAWGVRVDPDTKKVETFYVNSDAGTTVTNDTLDTNNLDNISVVGDSRYFLFTTPFGKYYSYQTPPVQTAWAINSQRPYDLIPSGVTASETRITLEYRNSIRTVVIAQNGDVYAQ